MEVILAALALLAAEPAELRVVAPAGGFRTTRSSAVFVLEVDSTGALVDGAAPVVSATGAAAGTPAKVVAGIWRVDVTPSAASGEIVVSDGAARASLPIAARTGDEAALAISLSRASLGPGDRTAVTATVVVKDASGAPLDLAPVVEVSAGTAGSPSRVGPGRYDVVVHPPPERFPQAVAVVALIPAKDVTPVATVLSLGGRASVPIHTKPKSTVTVHVGKRSYGSLTADANGDVEAVVDAWPIDTAMMVDSLDDVGNRSTRSLPLDAPPFARLWSWVETRGTGIDAKARVVAHARLLDRRGVLVEHPKAVITLGGAALALGEETRVAVAPGPAKVSFTLEGESRSRDVTIAPAPAVAINIDAPATPLVAGAAGVDVGAQLVDASSRAISEGTLELTGDGVTLANGPHGAGKASATVSLPGAALPSRAAVVARAPASAGLPALAATRTLAMRAGAAARAEVVAAPKTLMAGGPAAPLEVRFADTWGNPVAGLSPGSRASLGALGSASEAGAGVYRLSLKPGSTPGTSKIVIESGAARAELALDILRAPRANMLAIGVGGVSNLGALHSGLVSLEGRRALGDGGSAWWLVLRLMGAQGSFRLNAFGGPYDVTVQQGVAMFGVRRRFGDPMAVWSFSTAAFAAGGMAGVNVKGAGVAPDRGGTITGARIAGTAERRLGVDGALVVEAGAGWTTANSTVVKNNVSGAEFTVGYRHAF